MVPQNAQATRHYPLTHGTTPMLSRVFVPVWDVQSRKDGQSKKKKGVRLPKDESEAVNGDGDEDDSEGGAVSEDGEYERPWSGDDIEGGTGIA